MTARIGAAHIAAVPFVTAVTVVLSFFALSVIHRASFARLLAQRRELGQ
jgi:hypothetical protein